MSTSKACEALGTCESATCRPGGAAWTALAAADAFPVATAVAVVATRPPMAAMAMVDIMFLRNPFLAKQDNPALSNGRTSF